MDCLFCSIAEKKVPSVVVYEDESVLAFLDIHPLSLGHAVIIPKRHVENIIKLPQELVGRVFLAVQKVTAMLDSALSPKGFTIGINHGRVSGQTIDHLHIHVIPRYEGDGGGSIHSVVHNPPAEPLEETRSRILNSNN